jgi:hypothetical protein
MTARLRLSLINPWDSVILQVTTSEDSSWLLSFPFSMLFHRLAKELSGVSLWKEHVIQVRHPPKREKAFKKQRLKNYMHTDVEIPHTIKI